ncbi:MAG: hypothetical protein A2158_03750 [Chloroflexi bacterium RBG_13_46_14]|nr:MAG: hypothetical protein A2158_03750 [Chloroflexi bacterium RBG_13_46_14]
MAVRDDYDKNSVDCCLSYLVEVFTILGQFRKHIAIVGGWVPFLLFNNPEDQHCGSMEIDIVLEFDAITQETYDTILTLLQKNSFVQGTQPYVFLKQATTEARIPFQVEVDLLAGEYGGTSTGHRHQDVQGIKARKVRGADLVFKEAVVKTLTSRMPGGGINEVEVKIAGAVPFLVMKGMALWTRKELKDAYDIFYVVNNYTGGINALVKAFEPYKEHGLVIEGLGKI